MQFVSLPRTGQRSLQFHGTTLVHAKSMAFQLHIKAPDNKCHWFESTVYRTAGSQFVTYIAYRWAGSLYREVNDDFVDVSDNADDVWHAIDEYEPLKRLGGFPPGKAFAARQRRLEEAVLADYRGLKATMQHNLFSIEEAETL